MTDSLKERSNEGDISKKKKKKKVTNLTLNNEMVLVIRQLFGASLARWRSND